MAHEILSKVERLARRIRIQFSWKWLLLGFIIGFHFVFIFMGVALPVIFGIITHTHPENAFASLPTDEPSYIRFFRNTYFSSVINPDMGQIVNLVMAIVWALFGAVFSWSRSKSKTKSRSFLLKWVIAFFGIVLLSYLVVYGVWFLYYLY